MYRRYACTARRRTVLLNAMKLCPWAAVVAVVMLVSGAGASISSGDDDHYNMLPGIGDALWLRYPLISSLARRAEYIQLIGTRVAVFYREDDEGTAYVVKSQLDAAAQELRTGLSGLLGEQIQVTVGKAAADATLVASVLPAEAAALGTEGFRISQADGIVRLDAASSSALLYGVFRFLATMQQHGPVPANYTSKPAMERRVWQLWDVRATFNHGSPARAFSYLGAHPCPNSLHANLHCTGTRRSSHPRLRREVLAVATCVVPRQRGAASQQALFDSMQCE
eukprot:COSAG02_NODE_2068_length_9943_cov_5.977245_12_plen_281_part_00